MAKKDLPIVPSSSQKFIESFSYDVRLAPYDIAGSIAHATMLGRQRIIPSAAAKRIVKGLQSIQSDLERGWRLPVQEDIHFALERELIQRLGSVGGMVHTGRSRNDQVITDLCLYLRAHVDTTVDAIKRLQESILAVAIEYETAIMPGFTHLQHAQPILFAHHILAYAWMLERDKGRLLDCRKRLDVLPLGSAALAGTSFPIDRKYVAKLLGFSRISDNSIDATASRDVPAEFLSACALLMSNLSRFCEELVIWSTAEFSFIKLTSEFTSGSSIMPQKRNPDVAEIVRGETGRVYGSLVALLTLLKGLPLSYNRDLQEDKPPLFDAVDTVSGCLSVMAPMIRSMQVNTLTMKQWCDHGFLAATELADFLARKGVPFRTAHGVVRQIVAYCERRKIRLDQMSLLELKVFHSAFDAESLSLLAPEKVVRAKKSDGGTSPESVRRQIAKLRRLLLS
jgi:argininosuccinate lyase